ncbi:MAG: 60S ribosomal export protein NMD3 [Candidatus Aramenus sp.]|nr:60S ribosomal export protein NMD3 [Candidatus Aramenus sp.]
MPGKFCVRCGKENVELIDRLCIDCYLETKSLFAFPKEIKGKVCRVCGAEFIEGKWERIHEDVENAVKDLTLRELSKRVEVDKNVSNYSIDVGEVWRDSNGRDHVEIVARGSLRERRIEVKGDSFMGIEYVLCDTCKKRKAKYYEAIIQLRGKKSGLEREKRRLFESFFTEEVIANLADVVEGKEGVDYYFIKKSVARKLVSYVASSVDVTVNESFQDESIKKGKRTAKLVISLRV